MLADFENSAHSEESERNDESASHPVEFMSSSVCLLRRHRACRLLLSGGDLDDNESDDDDHDHDDDDHDHDCHMRQQFGELALTIPAVLMRGQNLEHNAYFNLFRQNVLIH